jgi:hypothetical protein
LYENDPTRIESILHAPPLPVPMEIEELARRGHDAFCQQQSCLPHDWATKRPEEIPPAQFIELTRLIYSGVPHQHRDNRDNDPDDDDDRGRHEVVNSLGTKVWRKLKHGE